jgi:hypothetical protein
MALWVPGGIDMSTGNVSPEVIVADACTGLAYSRPSLFARLCSVCSAVLVLRGLWLTVRVRATRWRICLSCASLWTSLPPRMSLTFNYRSRTLHTRLYITPDRFCFSNIKKCKSKSH